MSNYKNVIKLPCNTFGYLYKFWFLYYINRMVFYIVAFYNILYMQVSSYNGQNDMRMSVTSIVLPGFLNSNLK